MGSFLIRTCLIGIQRCGFDQKRFQIGQLNLPGGSGTSFILAFF